MTDKQNHLEIDAELGTKILNLVLVILKRKLLILVMCGATVILSTAYSLTIPNIYSATAKVLPPKSESSGLSSLMGQMGGLAGLAGGAKGGTDSDLYMGILNSRSLADAVIKRLDLAKVYKSGTVDELRQTLDSAVNVQTGKDQIISIIAQDTDPTRAALLANTFVDELGRATVRLNLSKVGAEKYFLEKRLEVTKVDLKSAEDDLKVFSERNKILQPEAQAGAALTGITALKVSIATAEVQLAVLRSSQTDESFEVKSQLAAIKRMKQDLARLSGINGGGEGVPSVGDVPGVGLAYMRKMREVKTQEAIFEQLTKQYELAKLNEARDSSSLQVLDDAVVPEVKSKPQRSILVIFATLTAFFASILIAFALEFLDNMSDENRKLLRNLKKQAFSLK